MQISNLHEFLKNYPHTEKALDYFKDVFRFMVDFKMSQRKMVQLGRALGRLVIMNLTIEIGMRGFNADMVKNSLKVLQNEIQTILSSFKLGVAPEVVEDYQNDNSWLNTL